MFLSFWHCTARCSLWFRGPVGCLLLSCPSPHANINLSSQKIFQGDWMLSFPNEEMKRPKSACPHRVGIWQRSEVAPRPHGEQLKNTPSTPKASKLGAGWSHPRENPHSASPCRIMLGPGRMGTSLPSHMAPSLLWALDEKEIVTVIISLHPQTVCS